MKRTLSLLIAMIFCVAVFSACQSAGARSPGDQAVDVQSVVAAETAAESPVRQVFTVRRSDGIKLNALRADVKTDAGKQRLNSPVRLLKFIKQEPSNDLTEELPPDRFNGYGTDCAARAKI